MLFNSVQFIIFFFIVLLFYWSVPNKYRWRVLLVSSYFFYMSWNIWYVTLILFTTCVSYFAALALEKTDNTILRKAIIWFVVVSCLGVLFVFKYYKFFFETITYLSGLFHANIHTVTLELLLPVGISFYTFQTMSYVVDVYRGETEPEHNFGIYATFVSFFPQLVAGPIERTNNLLPQINAEHRIKPDKVLYGLKLMLWGYFKKLVVADGLAIYVDQIYGNLRTYRGFSLVIAIIFFSLQIYCDFSGYSDIARGVAKLLDIELMRNFRSPYFSSSIKEFWSRWHISLSTWFRDYVYIPLGGNRVKKSRNYLNLLITFLVSGLWHGADWSYVIWGGTHGFFQVVENILGIKAVDKYTLSRCLRIVITFCLISLAWVFFRTQSIWDSIYVFSHMFSGIGAPIRYVQEGIEAIGMSYGLALYLFLFFFLPLGLVDFLGVRINDEGLVAIDKWETPFRWLFYILLGLIVIFFSQKGVAAEFVYFQF